MWLEDENRKQNQSTERDKIPALWIAPRIKNEMGKIQMSIFCFLIMHTKKKEPENVSTESPALEVNIQQKFFLKVSSVLFHFAL